MHHRTWCRRQSRERRRMRQRGQPPPAILRVLPNSHLFLACRVMSLVARITCQLPAIKWSGRVQGRGGRSNAPWHARRREMPRVLRLPGAEGSQTSISRGPPLLTRGRGRASRMGFGHVREPVTRHSAVLPWRRTCLRKVTRRRCVTFQAQNVAISRRLPSRTGPALLGQHLDDPVIPPLSCVQCDTPTALLPYALGPNP